MFTAADWDGMVRLTAKPKEIQKACAVHPCNVGTGGQRGQAPPDADPQDDQSSESSMQVYPLECGSTRVKCLWCLT